MWFYCKQQLAQALLWLVRGLRTHSPPSLDVGVPGLQLQHLGWRMYWLRIDVQKICEEHKSRTFPKIFDGSDGPSSDS